MTKEIATQNFQIWNAALQTKDPHKVAELYSEDATFLPTLSADFKQGKEGAEEYFIHFLAKNPNGQIIDEKIQELADDCYSHSGMYTFEIGPEDNRQMAQARFTFILKKINETWKIIHHHSSVLPSV